MVRHILRQITPLLGMLLAFEAGSTLMIIAALGFLGYYLGGAFWIEVTDFSARAISGLPELGQMLAELLADFQAVGHGGDRHRDLRRPCLASTWSARGCAGS